MTFVITSACIDVKDGACQKVCPVDCIYEGGRMMYIQPDECIDCNMCVPACPVKAIYRDSEMPGEEELFLTANAEFFGENVTGWGSPGGTDPEHVSKLDSPLVRDFAVKKS